MAEYTLPKNVMKKTDSEKLLNDRLPLLSEQVEANETQVEANETAIETNETAIETNETAIETNALEISGKLITNVASATGTIPAKGFVSVTYTATGAVALDAPLAADMYDAETGRSSEVDIADTGALAATNNITISRSGTDTIITDTAGQTSFVMSGNGDVITLIAINATTLKVK